MAETIRRQEQELAALRALPQRVDEVRREAEREAERHAEAERRAALAEEKARAEQVAATEARHWQERLTRAGWRERRRLLREARAFVMADHVLGASGLPCDDVPPPMARTPKTSDGV